MPPTMPLARNQRAQSTQIDMEGIKPYRYPNKLNLRPGSEKHRKLVDAAEYLSLMLELKS